MGNVAYFWITDNAGSIVKGGSQVFDRAGSVEVYKVSYNLSRSYDAQTGKIHGTRRHDPITILKPIDSATPVLFGGCASGALFPAAKLDLYKIDDEGNEVNYFSYEFENLRVISVTPCIDSDSGRQDTEAVSFSFEKVSLTFHDGNISVIDTWESR